MSLEPVKEPQRTRLEWEETEGCAVRSELLQPGSTKSMEGEAKWGVYEWQDKEEPLKKRRRSD